MPNDSISVVFFRPLSRMKFILNKGLGIYDFHTSSNSSIPRLNENIQRLGKSVVGMFQTPSTQRFLSYIVHSLERIQTRKYTMGTERNMQEPHVR